MLLKISLILVVCAFLINLRNAASDTVVPTSEPEDCSVKTTQVPTSEPEDCSVKTTQGKCCHFPFTYRGKVYQSCTTKNHDKPWCSTTANYDQDGQWGNCLPTLQGWNSSIPFAILALRLRLRNGVHDKNRVIRKQIIPESLVSRPVGQDSWNEFGDKTNRNAPIKRCAFLWKRVDQ
ncbi:coagulation factor XII-like isoform X2 [Montipora foliosa]|uniref:coagulation factor XII-like isoform X2 n=1 Tax=Montipora foliosa TaxID=591990 RepID=UPI0035F1DB42